MVLERLQLTQDLRNVAANRWCHYFHGLDYSLRIDEEAAPDIHSCPLVIHSIHLSDFASGVRQHRIWYTAVHHFGKFLLLPDLVGEKAIHTDGQYFHSQLLKFLILDGNCRQFRRSDTGEVGGVKTEPLAFVVRKCDFLGLTLMVRLGIKIRGLLANSSCHFAFLLLRVFSHQSLRLVGKNRTFSRLHRCIFCLSRCATSFLY